LFVLQFQLGKLNDEELWCSRYQTSFLVTDKNVRQVPKFTTPNSREHSQETLVADPRVLPSGNTLAKEIAIHHEPELQGGFKALRDKGIRITSYHEELP
jgi:hypothetical protein